MNIETYCKENKEKFELGKGLPEGDTFIHRTSNIKEVKKEFDGTTKTLWEITDVNENKYIVGKGVLTGLFTKIKNGHEYIRITRSGTGKTDTRYTYLGVSEPIKVQKETH